MQKRVFYLGTSSLVRIGPVFSARHRAHPVSAQRREICSKCTIYVYTYIDITRTHRRLLSMTQVADKGEHSNEFSEGKHRAANVVMFNNVSLYVQ